MKNEIFDNMLSRYDLTTEQQKRNAIFEVNQQVILAGLYAGGFFESAAFYGGTCLRIFHGLQRFSEDMDFSLLTQDDKFDFTKYFPAIVDAFTMVGREVEIKKKDKRNFGKVESAFLKDNTDVYDVTFQTEKSIKIKIEVDTCPPTDSEHHEGNQHDDFVYPHDDTCRQRCEPQLRRILFHARHFVHAGLLHCRLYQVGIGCARVGDIRLRLQVRVHRVTHMDELLNFLEPVRYL